jgi:hypothetical protein
MAQIYLKYCLLENKKCIVALLMMLAMIDQCNQQYDVWYHWSLIFKAVPQNVLSYVGGIPGHTLLVSLVSHAPITSKPVAAAHA